MPPTLSGKCTKCGKPIWSHNKTGYCYACMPHHGRAKKGRPIPAGDPPDTKAIIERGLEHLREMGPEAAIIAIAEGLKHAKE